MPNRRLHIVVSFFFLTCNPLLVNGDQGQQYPQKNYSATKLQPMDLTAFKTATETGGDFYLWAPGEFKSPQAMDLMAKMGLKWRTVPLLYKFGTLSQQDSKKEYTFSVDQNFNQISVLAVIQSKDRIKIIQPNGQLLSSHDKQSKFYTFTHMLNVFINQPGTGIWHIEIAGEGNYVISVRP